MCAARVAGQMLVRDAELGGTAPLTGPYASSRSGGIDLSLGEFGFVHVTPDCVLDAAGGVALNLRNADLRSSVELADGVTVRGTITLDGASVGGNLVLRGVHLSAPGEGTAAVGTECAGAR